MERFAFKIDKALRQNLYKICRLCGIDNPDKVPILSEENQEEGVFNVDGEPELWQKINACVGFVITKDDKMPQNICTLCVDKINDFFEFREMCYATNAQTRKLLGLRMELPKKSLSIDVKPEIKPDLKQRPKKRKLDEAQTKIDIKKDLDCDGNIIASSSSSPLKKKLRFSDTTPVPPAIAQKKSQKQRVQDDKKLKPKEEIKDEPIEVAPPIQAVASNAALHKLKQLCNICDQRFSNKVKLERHQSIAHLPIIPRYICTACDETLNKSNDIKNHQLWHKLSKTPYKCALCDVDFLSIYGFSRHLRDHCLEVKNNLLVLDRVCPQCSGTFVTNFLYNIHPCAVHTKKCAGCNRQQRNSTDYLRHSSVCAKAYLNYSRHITTAEVVAESCVRIKNENDVEAAAAAEALARTSGVSLDMTPVVSLTRLSTPILMAADQCVVIPSNEDDVEVNRKNPKKK